MSIMNPITPDVASERVAQTYMRIKEMLRTEEIPTPFLIYGNVEPFLRDFYMNFKKFVYTEGTLDTKNKAAIALAVAANAKSGLWTKYLADYCQTVGFTAEQVGEILAVGATNAMYNTFFKFREMSGSDRFEGMGVGLRAHTFTNTSLSETTVELINIAISDINACKPCTSGHVDKARQLGASNEQILEAIQCAATMYAGAQFLNAVM